MWQRSEKFYRFKICYVQCKNGVRSLLECVGFIAINSVISERLCGRDVDSAREEMKLLSTCKSSYHAHNTNVDGSEKVSKNYFYDIIM